MMMNDDDDDDNNNNNNTSVALKPLELDLANRVLIIQRLN